MKTYSAIDLEIGARHVLELQKEVLLSTGEAPLTIYGLKLKRGELEMDDIPSPGPEADFTSHLPDLVPRFDVVCTAAETWAAPISSLNRSEHFLRREILQIALYSEGAVHMLTSDILRNPLRLENIAFAQGEVTGCLTPFG